MKAFKGWFPCPQSQYNKELNPDFFYAILHLQRNLIIFSEALQSSTTKIRTHFFLVEITYEGLNTNAMQLG